MDSKRRNAAGNLRLAVLGFQSAILILTLLAVTLRASVDEALQATCRIRCADGSTGSGCTFAIDQGKVWVITAAHVVRSAGGEVTCEFWRDGHQSSPLPGRVYSRNDSYDVALVIVDEGLFAGLLPKVIRLAPPDRVLARGETISSAGCALGAWETGFQGHAQGYSGMDLYFVPPPANGRSGSALLDRDGKSIVGIVTARMGDNSVGIASSIQAVYAAFGSPERRKTALAALEAATEPRPAATCPDGSCPTPDDSRWYLLPYRYRNQRSPEPSPELSPPPSPSPAPAWPTLPPPSPREEPSPPPRQEPPKSEPPKIEIRPPPAPDVTIDTAPLAEPLKGLADAQKSLSDAVAGYLEAETRRKAQAEAEKKVGQVAPAVSEAAGEAIHGDFSGAADTLGTSGGIWATLAEVAWAVVAPLLGLGAVGYGAGRIIVRAIARRLGPTAYTSAKSAVVDWWKDDNDTPEEARAKKRMAEATAEATVKKLNGSAAPAGSSG